MGLTGRVAHFGANREDGGLTGRIEKIGFHHDAVRAVLFPHGA